MFDGVATLEGWRPNNLWVMFGSVDERLLGMVKLESAFKIARFTGLECLDLWNELVWLWRLLALSTGSFSFVTFLWNWRSKADFIYLATVLFLLCVLLSSFSFYKSLPRGGESATGLNGPTGLVAEWMVSWPCWPKVARDEEFGSFGPNIVLITFELLVPAFFDWFFSLSRCFSSEVMRASRLARYVACLSAAGPASYALLKDSLYECDYPEESSMLWRLWIKEA